jgi:hypothetical protein
MMENSDVGEGRSAVEGAILLGPRAIMGSVWSGHVFVIKRGKMSQQELLSATLQLGPRGI